MDNAVSFRGTWPTRPPRDCPFESSQRIQGIRFTGRHVAYTRADTWFPSWAADDYLYTPWTDGSLSRTPHDELTHREWWNYECSSDLRHGINVQRGDGKVMTGLARIWGDDPTDLRIEPLGYLLSTPLPYRGRYPCGSLVYRGTWFYGTYCLEESGRGLNWDVLGPFVGFHVSRDLGRTWEDPPFTPSRPMFGESPWYDVVKIGAPHVVDFGKELQWSPDGYAYFVAHGGLRSSARTTWISGDAIYLFRVPPDPQAIHTPSAYEFFCGIHDGCPRWSHDRAHMQPLLVWEGKMGCVTVTYHPYLETFFMCVTGGWPTVGLMDTYILESPQLTGPWRLVSYLGGFGPQAYFVTIPSKFLSTDGRTAWIWYSANFMNKMIPGNPPGSTYALCAQEILFEF